MGCHRPGSKKIVDTQLIQVSEVQNSNHMEPEGIRRGLKQVLTGDKLDVKVLATDQHVMVGSIMKRELPHIWHQFDVWHMAKGLLKKLTAKCTKTKCEELGPWIRSICNHLWYCTASCNGDLEKR